MHIGAVLLPVCELFGGGVSHRKSTQRAKLPKDLGSWPLWRLSLLFLILHVLALGVFAAGFLLTRIELPTRSLPADSLACNPEPPVRKLVWIIIDALRWDFVSNSTGSSNKLGGMPILQDIANAAVSCSKSWQDMNVKPCLLHIQIWYKVAWAAGSSCTADKVCGRSSHNYHAAAQRTHDGN